MSITLSPELTARVNATLAKSGHNSAEELLVAALWEWEEAHEAEELDGGGAADGERALEFPDREELIRSLQDAQDELNRGEGIPHDVVFDELWRRVGGRPAK